MKCYCTIQIYGCKDGEGNPIISMDRILKPRLTPSGGLTYKTYNIMATTNQAQKMIDGAQEN